MTAVINIMIFVFLMAGFWGVTGWLWEVGVQEILIYTESFLLEEAEKLRVKVLPEITSTRPLDKLELLLYYSGICNYFPFISAKVWLLFSFIVYSCCFVAAVLLTGTIRSGAVFCLALWFCMTQLLGWMRQRNLRLTERQLLELLNITESFAVTGDEPVAILQNCSLYMTGPIGHALKSIDKHIDQGWSGRMILEQLKITLEHPKWQEFIHNLHVCSMYNSDFNYVFRSSRKSIQSYLSSKKERQSIKHTAQIEMSIITGLSLVIVVVLGKFLSLPVYKLVWGNSFGRICTVYMAGIILVFYWKIGAYEKE